MKAGHFLSIVACAILLGSCSSTRTDVASPAAVKIAPSYSADGLVGRWGVASYRNEKDRARTEAMARAQCRLPYVITKGPSDGVMMHVADDSQLYELTLKGSKDGKTYLGFDAPPGDPQDREILSFSDKLIIMQYTNPETNGRYGTFVYTRCA